MVLTAGTYGYSFLDAFSNSIIGNLFVVYCDASIFDALLDSSPFSALGESGLAVTLTFDELVEVWGRNACNLTRPTLGVF